MVPCLSLRRSIKVTTVGNPDTSMSLLSMIQQAIKSCKAEQAKTNDSIQLYREILHTLTPQPKIGLEESDSADDAPTGNTDTDTSPREREDIELLERALEKALQVRTGTGPSKKPASRKDPGTAAATSVGGGQTSAAAKGIQTTKSASKSAKPDRKEHKRPAGTLNQQLAGRSHQAVRVSGSLDAGQLHTSTLHSKNKTSRSKVLSGNDLDKAAALSTPSSNNTAPTLHPAEAGAHSLPRQNGIVSDQTAKWKSLRRKENRWPKLWDKVAALERKPVPGRSRFMERMRATFPEDWPVGSPDQTRALADRLTHQGHDLIQQCHTQELLAKQSSEAATEPGGETLERLQMTAAELQNLARKVKQEWEAWDRWRPEGGCLCPTGANDVWGDGTVEPLPPTITYATEAELRELEGLRMRVALLQQEIHLEQTLSDTLSPQLSSLVSGPGSPNVSVLRDVYSLLGEGGQRFPAIVLDSEPD